MILGIDSSCYTSSIALVTEAGQVVKDKRRLLPVKEGTCGLRQPEALFLHMQNLPELLAETYRGVDMQQIRAVVAAIKPRPLPESYMPVFKAAENFGQTIALSLQVPFISSSHQEGHIAAAAWSLQMDQSQPFLAVHLSGGTTEILRVEQKKAGYNIDIVGNSDLAAGQFVDRVGVALGLPFPAGPDLEKLAIKGNINATKLTVAVKGSQISFSGPESQAQRILKGEYNSADLALAVLINIAKTVLKAVINVMREQKLSQVMLMGGVAANTIIVDYIKENAPENLHILFAKRAYAGDNAVGIALLGRSVLQ